MAINQGADLNPQDEVAPIDAFPCSKEEARDKFEEFFERYERGGGTNLRVELRRTIHGVRFALVCDWDDMS